VWRGGMAQLDVCLSMKPKLEGSNPSAQKKFSDINYLERGFQTLILEFWIPLDIYFVWDSLKLRIQINMFNVRLHIGLSKKVDKLLSTLQHKTLSDHLAIIG
jgi:hypothetical protein